MKFHGMLAAGLLFCGLAACGATNSLSDLRGLKTRETRIPVYSNDRLQLLLYCEECGQSGRGLAATAPVLDIIRKDADIDSITTGKDTKIYPLGADFPAVLNFWSKRLFSDGVAVTTKADIDQENQQAASGEKVYFRSPLLDLDGIGFDGDYRKRTIFVRKDVRIILRTGASDPLKFVGRPRLPEKYEFIRGSADTLLIDMDKRAITLQGHVRLREERGSLDCDRLMIYLPDKKSKRDLADNEELSIKGVSRIVCEGGVRMVRQGVKEVQRADGERLDYDLQTGRLRLTGSMDRLPVIVQGKNSLQGRVIDIYRDDERLHVEQNARILYYRREEDGKEQEICATSQMMDFSGKKNSGEMRGNVSVRNRQYTLLCGRLQVKLRDNGKKLNTREKQAGSDVTGIPDIAPAGGSRELQSLHCSEGVRMIRKTAAGSVPEYAEAGEADLQMPQEVITLTGRRPTLTRGQDTLSGEQIIIFAKEERLLAYPDSKIVFHGNFNNPALQSRGKKAAKAISSTIITAERGDFRYGENQMNLLGNVQVLDPHMKLNCEKMDIFLKPNQQVRTAIRLEDLNAGSDSLTGPNARKQLDRIICGGKVRAVEPRAKLDCDMLTLTFRPAAGKAVPGVLQSNGTEMEFIYADGNVVMESIPEKKTASTAGKKSDRDLMFDSSSPVRLTASNGRVNIPGNITELHGHVKVRHIQGSMDCQDLYLYAKDVAGETAESAGGERLAAIDEDPFAANEPTKVPQVLSISDGKQLDRAVADKDVVLVRNLPGNRKQQALGEKAEYFVSRRMIELTGKPPELARVIDSVPRNNGRGEKITVYLDREAVAFDGRVQMDFDATQKPGDQGFSTDFLK